MTDYHNDKLRQAVGDLEKQLPDTELLLVDSQSLIKSILAGRYFSEPDSRFDYGFAFEELQQQLEYDQHVLTLPKNCYSGIYLGSFNESDTCADSARALFWDVVHPTTYAHCWQAYQVGTALASAGWIANMPNPDDYRAWCQRFKQRDKRP